jgi:hypothetical protein
MRRRGFGVGGTPGSAPEWQRTAGAFRRRRGVGFLRGATEANRVEYRIFVLRDITGTPSCTRVTNKPLNVLLCNSPALTPLALELQRELVDRIMNKTQDLSLKTL